MQNAITPNAAGIFVRQLYNRWLRDGLPLETAVTDARQLLYDSYRDEVITDPNAWMIPVLFMTSEITIEGGQPVVSPEKQRQINELRSQIRERDQAIYECEDKLTLPTTEENKKKLRMAKSIYEAEREKKKKQWGELLDTYVDLENVRIESENLSSVRVPVHLPTRSHRPTGVVFEVEFDGTVLEFQDVKGCAGNYVGYELVQGKTQIGITKGPQGEIQREGDCIGTLVFALKQRKSTILTPKAVKVIEGNKIVSQEGASALITVA